jgi:hypothetical protein
MVFGRAITTYRMTDASGAFRSEHDVANVPRFIHVENDDRNFVVHAKAERCRIHHLQPFAQRFRVSDLIVTLRRRIAIGIAIVDAIHLGRFQYDVRANLTSAQCSGGISREIRIAGAGDEDDDAAKFQVTNRAAQDEWLGHVLHLDRGLHSRLHADLDQTALQREAVDHRGQHSHVVSGRAIHAAVRGRQTAPDISSADHDRNLYPEIANLLHALGYFADDLRRDIVAAAAFLERFPAQFENDAFVHGRARFTLHGEDVETERRSVGKQNATVRVITCHPEPSRRRGTSPTCTRFARAIARGLKSTVDVTRKP